MAKIKLGERPKSFKHTVKFPMIDGTDGTIACVFKYRTRKEFGEFIDAIMEAAGVKPQEDGEKFSMAALMEKTAGANADYILQVLDGWNLEEPLSRASLEQLADEIPAATTAIMEQYRVAITEGRLGN
jgi:hypothetical protein